MTENNDDIFVENIQITNKLSYIKSKINELQNIDLSVFNKNSSILDSNISEKLIIEMNNHISLGQYELARGYIKNLIITCPLYIEYFYRFLFIRGIPDKWLLTNRIRTSSNYLWLLYNDYLNVFSLENSCPSINLNLTFIENIKFDLLLSSLFYDSLENANILKKVSLSLIKSLKYMYITFKYLSINTPIYSPKLRMINPYDYQNTLFIEIEEIFLNQNTFLKMKFDFLGQFPFYQNLKNLFLNQSKLSFEIIYEILSISFDIDNKDKEKLFEIVYEILFELIYMFFCFDDYDKIYIYLSKIPFFIYNKSFIGNIYIIFIFCMIVFYVNNPFKKSHNLTELVEYIRYVLENENFKERVPQRYNNLLVYILNNKQFDTSKLDYARKSLTLDSNEKIILYKNKVVEALLISNSSKKLLDFMNMMEDYYVKYLSTKSDIPHFFLKYYNNMKNIKENVYDGITYKEIINYEIIYSSKLRINNNETNSKISIWKQSFDYVFYDEYINFLKLTQENFLLFPFNQALSYASNGQFTKANIILHPFNNLKPILIILILNKYRNDIISQKNILESIWNSYKEMKDIKYEESKYPCLGYFENMIIYLEYLVYFSIWIIWIESKINNSLSGGNSQFNKKTTSIDIYNKLINSSLSFVLSNYLSQLSFHELSNFFILNFPKNNHFLQRQTFYSVMIIYSYYIYYVILHKLDKLYKNNSNQVNFHINIFSNEEYTHIAYMFNSILIFPYRLNILLKIFNFSLNKYTSQVVNRQCLQQNLNNDDLRNEQFTATSIDETHMSSSYLYQKRIFFSILQFLIESSIDIKDFDFELNDLKSILSNKYLSDSSLRMIENAKKESIIYDLYEIDSDYIEFKSNYVNRIDGNSSYKEYLIKKRDFFIRNITEIHCRYNIINNYWLEALKDNELSSNFFSELLQPNIYYYSIIKRYQNWEISNKAFEIFNFDEEKKTEMKILKCYSSIRNQLEAITSQKEEEYEEIFHNQIPIISKDTNNDELEKNQTFEQFKYYFDLSLLNIPTKISKRLFSKSKSLYEEFLNSSFDIKNNQKYIKILSLINWYETIVNEDNLNNKKETVSKIITSLRNLGSVEVSDYKAKLNEKLNREASLISLMNKVNDDNSSYEIIRESFIDALKSLKDINKEEYGRFNYLERFLDYIYNIGSIYHKANKNSTFLKIMDMYPKEIIADLLFKFNLVEEAMEVSKITNISIVTVIKEYVNCKSTQYNINLRLLRYLYNVYTNNNQFELNFFPMYISLYKVDISLYSLSDQYEFWELLIKNFSSSILYKYMITQEYSKYYLTYIINSQTQSEESKDEKEIVIKSKFSILYKELRISQNESINDKENKTKIEAIINNNNRKYSNYLMNMKNNDLLLNTIADNNKKYSYIPKISRNSDEIQSKMKEYLEKKIKNKTVNSNSNNYLDILESNENIKASIKENTKKNISSNIYSFPFTNLSYKSNVKFNNYLINNLDFNDHLQQSTLLGIDEVELEKNDFLYKCILSGIENNQCEDYIACLILKIKSRKNLYEIIKKYVFKWRPETSLKILYILVSSEEISKEKKEIEELINKIELLNEIVNKGLYTNTNEENSNKKQEVYTINDINEECIKNIDTFINILINSKAHDLCYRLIEIYNISNKEEFKERIALSEIKFLLSSDSIEYKINAFEKLKQKSLDFCIKVLNEITNYKNKLLLINYILYYFNVVQHNLNTHMISKLENEKTSILVYFMLPDYIRNKFEDISNPNYMLETLIINQSFELLKSILEVFPSLRSEEMIKIYTLKAMNISKLLNDSKINNSKALSMSNTEMTINNLENLHEKFMTLSNHDSVNDNYCLIVNNYNLAYIRKSFQYKSAPSIQLYKEIVSFSKDINSIALIVFEICDNINRSIYHLEKSKKLILVDYIERVLDILNNKISIKELSSFIDYDSISYISRKLNIYKIGISYIRKFIINEIDYYIRLNMNDMSSCIEYNNKIKDILIENYFFSLAEDYCLDMNLDLSKIELKMGLFYLKNKEFTKAKQSLDRVMGKNLISIKNKLVLYEVMDILQGKLNLKLEEIKRIYHYLLYKYIKSSKHNPIFHIDELSLFLNKEKEKIKEETIYYIKTYGSEGELMKFYFNNNLLNNLSDYLILRRTSLSCFKSEILKKSNLKEEVRKEKIFQLAKELKKHSVNLNNGNNKEYIDTILNRIVLFISKYGSERDLIYWYELMKDYLQAGLYSLFLYNHSLCGESIEFLKISYENINKYLLNNVNEYPSLGNISISKYFSFTSKNTIFDMTDSIEISHDISSLNILKTSIDYQIKVLNNIPSIEASLLSDSLRNKEKIVEELILINSDLSFEILLFYNIDLYKVLMNKTFSLMSRMNSIENTTENTNNPYLNDETIKNFNLLLEIVEKWNRYGKLLSINITFEKLWNDIIKYAVSLIIDKHQDYVLYNLLPLLEDISYRVYILISLNKLYDAYDYIDILKDKSIVMEIKSKADILGMSDLSRKIEKELNN